MIDIATADFTFAIDPLGHDALEAYSLSLFNSWESWLSENVGLPDYSVRLEVEEGSLKGKGRLFATAAALYLGIGKYGSFRSGVRELVSDAREAGTFLVARALQPLSVTVPTTSRRTAGRLGELEGIFAKIERGEVEPNDAADEAVALFANEPDVPQTFLVALRKSVREMPRYPHQLNLLAPSILSGLTVEDDSSSSSSARHRAKKIPLPPPAPPTKYRVEVWRESKKGRRRFKILPL